jgi:hypothetical protein
MIFSYYGQRVGLSKRGRIHLSEEMEFKEQESDPIISQLDNAGLAGQ